MEKIQKSGQKSEFSEKRFIFQRSARIEATAKISGHWDQKRLQERQNICKKGFP